LVEPLEGARLLHVELILGVVAALFEHHHLRARAGETRGHHRAAGAAAHDADVRFEDEIGLAAFVNHFSTDFTNSYGGPG
jgi:hypothetical protein